MDEDIGNACVPTKYADGPKWRGIINIIEERIKLRNIFGRLKHHMEPKRLSLVKLSSKSQAGVGEEILFGRSSGKNDLVI